jgi:hypothetical protein
VTELWTVAAEWASSAARWLAAPFHELDAVTLEPRVMQLFAQCSALVRALAAYPSPNPAAASIALRERVAVFKEHLPLMMRLGHPGMRTHHWQQLSDETGVECMC